MALFAVLICTNFCCCTSEDELLNSEGLPLEIKNNTIYYKTSDGVIIRFDNEDVFGGAKIINNIYSTTKGYGRITFSSEVTAIEKLAFYECENLVNIVMPNSICSIGVSAFYYCSNLKTISLSSNITNLGGMAFYNCYNLEKVEIPSNVHKTGNYTFHGCKKLLKITIPSNLTNMGGGVFSGCDNLKEIHCKSKKPPIVNYYDVHPYDSAAPEQCTLYVPKGSLETYKKTPYWNTFKIIIEE